MEFLTEPPEFRSAPAVSAGLPAEYEDTCDPDDPEGRDTALPAPPSGMAAVDSQFIAALDRSNREALRRLPVGSFIDYSIHQGPGDEDLLVVGSYAPRRRLGPALHSGRVRRDAAGDTVVGDRWAGLRRTGQLTVFSGLTWRPMAVRLLSRFTDCRINRVSYPRPQRPGRA
ncbi:hypothetical protein [Streptomyces sp. NPDC051014]|uniref:hypothetical protein n=1 Tax=Streptomyces sp. NPDC051014 TaxID=3155751 RepID=UPI0034008A91